ncbi:hypothetical protein HAX54_011379 [Datura stramonium]|uniref:Uncharacterized protein n=1 Tax=Datura stramonium TaxID=4076 RepID=A0ABS8THW5_DATST|nr:hypothetical protein [Datura stramonium]
MKLRVGMSLKENGFSAQEGGKSSFPVCKRAPALGKRARIPSQKALQAQATVSVAQHGRKGKNVPQKNTLVTHSRAGSNGTVTEQMGKTLSSQSQLGQRISVSKQAGPAAHASQPIASEKSKLLLAQKQ